MVSREFAEQVRSRVESLAGSGNRAVIQEAWKNNGTRLTGIMVCGKGEKISPTVYLEPLLRPYAGDDVHDGGAEADGINGEKINTGQPDPERVDEIARLVLDAALIRKEPGADQIADEVVRIAGDKKALLSRVMPRLVNYGWNKEFLKEVPHRQFLDLAVTYVVPVSGALHKEENASVRVTNAWVHMADVTEDELYGAAMQNAMRQGFSAAPIDDIILSMAGADTDIEEQMPISRERPGLIVLTNAGCYYGAYVMCLPDAIAPIADAFDSDLAVLPSSVNEVIAIPMCLGIPVKDMKEMVEEVNRSAVPQEELLSDSVYIFDRRNKELRTAEG